MFSSLSSPWHTEIKINCLIAHIFIFSFFVLQINIVIHDVKHAEDKYDDSCVQCFVIDDNDNNDDDVQIHSLFVAETLFINASVSFNHSQEFHLYLNEIYYSTRAPPLA
ncbi:MAG TPA: hypothetical protein ENJ41_05360 [Oceanospirillales bacterium]|nr:hypothetical protein [Oceanospirillales bacterium]